jgi:general secretion pathway protein I
LIAARHKQKGFSLLEVLVAFVILATVLAALYQVLAGGLRARTVAEDYFAASVIAESKLAEVGYTIELKPAELGGLIGDRFEWALVIEPESHLDHGLPISGLPMRLFRLRVKVSWLDGGRSRELALDTLRLGPP